MEVMIRDNLSQNWHNLGGESRAQYSISSSMCVEVILFDVGMAGLRTLPGSRVASLSYD